MSQEQYYIRVRGRVQGPFDVDKLHSMAKRGQFSRLHEVSSDRTNWRRASDHPDLFPAASGAQRVMVKPHAASADAGTDNAADAGVRIAPPEPLVEWFYSRDGEQLGPVALSSLSAMLVSGQLCREDMVWKPGMPTWIPLSQVVPAAGASVGGVPPFMPGGNSRGGVATAPKRTSAGRIALIAAMVLIPLGALGVTVLGVVAWVVLSSHGSDGDTDDGDSADRPTIANLPKKKTSRNSLGTAQTPALPPTPDASDITDKYKPFVVRIQTEVGSIGSGLIIANSQTLGLILTNQHVIDPNFGKGPLKNCGKIDVRVASEAAKHPASLVAVHRTLDMALLTVDRTFTSQRAVRVISHDAIKQGEQVVALGYPFDIDYASSGGIVSKVDAGQIMTDCTINHGNSGGPLILMRKGLVAGVNTFGIEKVGDSNAHNLNFALCTDQALSVSSWAWAEEHDSAVDDLIKTVRLERHNEK